MVQVRPEFLLLLRCVRTRQPLVEAEADLVAEFNRRVAAGQLVNAAGDLVAKSFDGALVNEQRNWAYPIQDGLPVLLPDEAIALPLPALESASSGD